MFKDVGQVLSEPAEHVRNSTALTEEQELESIADIQILQAQLAKPEPNRSVLKAIWSGLQALGTVEGVAAIFQRVTALLQPLLG